MCSADRVRPFARLFPGAAWVSLSGSTEGGALVPSATWTQGLERPSKVFSIAALPQSHPNCSTFPFTLGSNGPEQAWQLLLDLELILD